MSVRFTSGGVGRLTFEHANRMADATDRVESMTTGDRVVQRRIDPSFIVARLTTKLGFTLPPQKYEVWNWVEIGVVGTRAARSIAQIPKGMTAIDIGESPIGRAIKVAGTCKPSDIVVLFPMKDETGESWYAFTGRPTVVATTSLLAILEATEVAQGIFSYQVEPRFIDTGRGLTPNTDLPSGVAFNAYEISERHDQPLIFENPPSRMEVIGPVKGPVVGILASAPDQPTVWMFEAPSPLRPVCGGPVPGAFGQLLNGGF